MMFTKIPQDFLANIENGSKVGSSFSDGARTPDTPSFTFFDADGNSNSRSAPSPLKLSSPTMRSPLVGLPTPPHSASSVKTFNSSSSQPPVSPLLLYESGVEATTAAAYRAKIYELEQMVGKLQKELSIYRAGGEPEPEPSHRSSKSFADGQTCDACGCACKNTPASILERPRVVGHGNMFSSGRG